MFRKFVGKSMIPRDTKNQSNFFTSQPMGTLHELISVLKLILGELRIKI